MKQYLVFFFCLITYAAVAQTPQGIPYQAVARNSSGAILANQAIRVRFTIHDSVATGTAAYRETFTPTTTAQGLFNVNVGMGTPDIGTFNSINWGHNAKFMQVEMDPAGGTSYVDMGTTQMMSVPYALYAGVSSALSSGGSLAADDFLVKNFGDGSDSNVIINSSSYSGGPITNNVLTRDAYFNSLTLSGGNLVTNGYRLFIRGTLVRQNSNKIFWNANDGSNGNPGYDANNGIGYGTGGTGGSGGAGLSDGTLKGSPNGGNGGSGGGAGGNFTVGGNASSATSISKSNCIGNPGVAGGAGGNGNSTNPPVYLSGGSAGASPLGITVSAVMKPKIVSLLSLMADWSGGTLSQYQNSTACTGGGGGGGGGGFMTSYSPWYYGGTGGGGGGGGSNSGVFFIAAYSITDSGSGEMFQFKGGNGGNGGSGGSSGGNNLSPNGGAAGGGGGGAGGNGGSGVLIYVSKSGPCLFDLSGGNGGNGGSGGSGTSGGTYPHSAGANGTNGTNGASGLLYEFKL